MPSSSIPIFPLIIPLATSTTTFGLALFQYPVFLSFLHARPSIAGRPLSRYWATFIRTWSLGLIVSTAFTSAGTALFVASRLRQSRFSDAAIWYLAGAISSLTHFAFIPAVSGPIQKIANGAETDYNDGQFTDLDYEPRDWNKEQKIEEINHQQQSLWLNYHTIRTFTVDIGAVLFFFKGFNAVFGNSLR